MGVTAERLRHLGTTRAGPDDLSSHLRAVHHHRLLLLKAVHERVHAERETLPTVELEDFARHWALLERAEERDPHSTRQVLTYPAVGSRLARVLHAREPQDFEAELPLVGQIAAAAALRSGCAFRLLLPAPGKELALPGIGGFDCPSGELLLGTDGGEEPSRAVARLPGGDTLLDDADPCYTPPEGGLSSPPAPHTGAAAEWWAQQWQEAMGLLAAADPQRAHEVGTLTRSLVPLVPLPGDPRGLYSATLRAAPGAVLTTPLEDAVVLAEVLVHEVQHTRLSVVCDTVPLHRPGGPAVHKVPWRTDLRPAGGVLQGVFAHLALADFWYRVACARRSDVPPSARKDARGRCGTYCEQVAEVLPTLAESAELTDDGREFVDGVAAHHGRLSAAAASMTGMR